MKHLLPTFALLISSLFAPVAVSAQDLVCNGPGGLVYVAASLSGLDCAQANVGTFTSATPGQCLVVDSLLELSFGACPSAPDAALVDGFNTFTAPNTFTHPITVTPSGGSVAGPVAPTYTATGAAAPSTTHCAEGSGTASGTTTGITLSGAAAFTGSGTYSVFYSHTGGIGPPPSAYQVNIQSGTYFQIVTTNTFPYNWYACGY